MERPVVTRRARLFRWLLLVVLLMGGGVALRQFWLRRQLPPPPAGAPLTLYFADKNGAFLIPIQRTRPADWPASTPEGPGTHQAPGARGAAPVPLVLREWAAGPRDSTNLLGLLPPGVALTDVRRGGNGWLMTFSEELERHLTGNSILREIFSSALFATLAPFALREAVRLQVAGPAGTRPLGDDDWIAIQAEELNMNQGETDPDLPEAAERVRLRLYFLSKGTRYLVPIIREVAKVPNRLEAIAREEIRGPRLRDLLESPFPPGTQLLSLERKGESVTLNLSREFATIADTPPVAARRAVDALLLTLTEEAGVAQVHLRVEGKEISWPSALRTADMTHRPLWFNREDAVEK